MEVVVSVDRAVKVVKVLMDHIVLWCNRQTPVMQSKMSSHGPPNGEENSNLLVLQHARNRGVLIGLVWALRCQQIRGAR